eukprot:tig00000498_g1628.t2
MEAIAAMMGLLMLSLFLIAFLKAQRNKAAQETAEEVAEQLQAGRAGARAADGDERGGVRQRRGRGGLAAMRNRVAAGAGERADEPVVADAGSDDEGAAGAKKGGTKKERNRQERDERRQEQRALLEAKEEKQKARDEARKKKDEDREEQERREAEMLQKLKEEREKKEQEEYEKWKHMFSTEQEGSKTVEEESESQGLLAEFIAYIQRRKVVPLDEIGGHFKLKPQDVISRVTTLEQMGRISGVIDDRGKFICVTREEMEKVAKFIERRGRISVADLCAESNALIDLNGAKEAEALPEVQWDLDDPAPEAEPGPEAPAAPVPAH